MSQDVTKQYQFASGNVCKIDVKGKTLSGFLSNGKVYTSLHGLVGNISPKGELTSLQITFYPYGADNISFSLSQHELELTGVDLDHDMAAISCKCFKKLGKGIEIGNLTAIGNNYFVYGFPGVSKMDEQRMEISSGAIDLLYKFLTAAVDLKELEFPNENVQVIKISSANISRGHSGSPILDKDNKVVGVVDGFELDGKYGKKHGWAVQLTPKNLPDKKPKNIYEILSKASLNQKNAIRIAFGEDQPIQSNVDTTYRRFANFKHVPPLIAIGGGLTKLYVLPVSTNRAINQWRLLNGFADIYVDFRLFKPLTLGVYSSSTFIQYQIIQSWGEGLPLGNVPIPNRREKLFDVWGGQLTWWWLRSIRADAFLGVGAGPMNYRGYIGARIYPFWRRKVGLEAKLLWTQQDFFNNSFFVPRLGMASRVINQISFNQLNNLHLCVGINFSVGKK